MTSADADEDLVVAEKIAPDKPGMLSVLAIAGIVSAIFKLGSLAMTLPWMLAPHLFQRDPDPNAPLELVEYQRQMVEVQAKYVTFQVGLAPLSILVAAALFWAALKAYQLSKRGDVWMRRVCAASAIVDAIGGVMFFLVQRDNFFALQAAFQNADTDNSTLSVMMIAMKAAFYFGMAIGGGYLLLHFAYYYFAFRYFSKSEVRALYQV
ncbi:MAG: hypothetical protein ACIALR_02130 [Blastopirellula sp. JB062]